MPFDNLLGDLLDAAFDSLSEKFKRDDSDYDSAKLIVGDANGDVFTFLLYNCKDSYRWERKIWYKQNDISTISNPIDSVKYFGQKIIPNIIEQQGVTELKEAKEVFSLTHFLLTIDNKEKSKNIVIDRTVYFLQIKLGKIVKDFKWDTIPPGWDSVEIIANKIIELNNKIY